MKNNFKDNFIVDIFCLAVGILRFYVGIFISINKKFANITFLNNANGFKCYGTKK